MLFPGMGEGIGDEFAFTFGNGATASSDVLGTTNQIRIGVLNTVFTNSIW